jgi:hypothetical protein
MNAYICITEPGSGLTQPITGFTIYSNVDNYLTPLVSNVPITNFTGSSCPYVLANVPEGTTTLRLYDFGAGCCIDIPYSDGFNICDICNPLGFSDNSSPNVGSISVGALTGGCDPTIGQYYLVWYGPGTGSTNQVFTSASQVNLFNLPQLIHPLTGTNQVYLTAGQYRPVIQYIDLNGVVYSYAFGATGDCFLNDPIVVLPYTATNGTGIGDYQHELTFSASSRPAVDHSGTIELSANTNYFPYRFEGDIYRKQLIIEFSGSSYPTPLLLENIFVGEIPNSTLDFRNYSTPDEPYKDAGPSSGFFTRVLCLTGLTINSGDTLIFHINSLADNGVLDGWNFYFSQLQNFDCTSCVLDTPKYLLSGTSFSASTGTCSSTTITFTISGCSQGIDDNKDIYKYILKNSDTAYAGDFGYGTGGLIPISVNIGAGPSDCGLGFLYANNQNLYDLNTQFGLDGQTAGFGIQVFNNTPTSKFIRYYYYADPNDPNADSLFNFWQTSYDNMISAFPPINDSTNIQYWSAVILNLGVTLANPQSPSSGQQAYFFPVNNHIATFQFAPNVQPNLTRYEMIIECEDFIEPIANFIAPCLRPECKGTNSVIYSAIVGKVLGSITLTNNLYEANTEPLGNAEAIFPPTFPEQPFQIVYPTVINTTNTSLTGTTTNSVKMYQYQFKTYPSTGTTYDSPQTYLSPLSAVTCNSLSGKTFNPYTGDTFDYRSSYWKYNFFYQFTTQENVPFGYNIYTVPILSNGQLSNTAPTLIATGTGSTITVIDSNYFTP